MRNEFALPIRFFDGKAITTSRVPLEAGRCAFVLVDIEGRQSAGRTQVVNEQIAPALQAARHAGLHVVYFYNAPPVWGGGGDITRELAERRSVPVPPEAPTESPWPLQLPEYPANVAPLPHEPRFQKSGKDGFASTEADYYLRSLGVGSLIVAGFALRSCVYQTCLGARHRNYRVVLLRDATCPPGEGEFPDTRDESNPEGGWMRYVFLRQFETVIGYTSTVPEFQTSLKEAE